MELPKNILQDSNSFVYSLFNDGILFQVVPPDNDTEIGLEIDTMIVGFTLFDEESPRQISGLSNPVIVTFQGRRAINNMVRVKTIETINHLIYGSHMCLVEFF